MASSSSQMLRKSNIARRSVSRSRSKAPGLNTIFDDDTLDEYGNAIQPERKVQSEDGSDIQDRLHVPGLDDLPGSRRGSRRGSALRTSQRRRSHVPDWDMRRFRSDSRSGISIDPLAAEKPIDLYDLDLQLSTIIRNKRTAHAFKQFLLAEHSDENILFWFAVAAYSSRQPLVAKKGNKGSTSLAQSVTTSRLFGKSSLSRALGIVSRNGPLSGKGAAAAAGAEAMEGHMRINARGSNSLFSVPGSNRASGDLISQGSPRSDSRNREPEPLDEEDQAVDKAFLEMHRTERLVEEEALKLMNPSGNQDSFSRSRSTSVVAAMSPGALLPGQVASGRSSPAIAEHSDNGEGHESSRSNMESELCRKHLLVELPPPPPGYNPEPDAKLIWSRYVAPDAPMQVTFPHGVIETLRIQIENGQFSPFMFNKAQAICYGVLEADCFRRFRRSPAYAAMLDVCMVDMIKYATHQRDGAPWQRMGRSRSRSRLTAEDSAMPSPLPSERSLGGDPSASMDGNSPLVLTLECLLSSPLGLAILQKYCAVHPFGKEPLEFLVQVEVYKMSNMGRKERKTAARKIFNDLITVQGLIHMVDPDIIDDVQEGLRKNPPRHLFQALQMATLSLLQHQVYPSFIASGMYRHALADMMMMIQKRKAERKAQREEAQRKAQAEARRQASLPQLDAVPFDTILEDPAWSKAFLDFCRKEHSQELIMFYLSALDFKDSPQSSWPGQANALFNTHLEPGSPFEVTYDGQAGSRLMTLLTNNQEDQYTADMFEDARLKVKELMNNGAYPRFLKSDQFRITHAKKFPSAAEGGDAAMDSSTTLLEDDDGGGGGGGGGWCGCFGKSKKNRVYEL